ncbi:hypothetical protein [Bordetella genomosp. 10]|uniref:hypothetical protein n=1 Tax=Bordetella genomosp. 10 TaxID=1416804 RepID=UPI0015C6881C|nr:hypothetical protein [Bordetella genomosp. 10]
MSFLLFRGAAVTLPARAGPVAPQAACSALGGRRRAGVRCRLIHVIHGTTLAEMA